MRSKPVLVAALICLASPTNAQTAVGGMPWFGFGPVDTVYALAIDTTVAFAGRASLLLQSLRGADASTWIASHQIVDARAYRGKRVRIRAHLRAQDVTSAGMWVVVDGFANGRPATLLSDSLTPGLRGSTAWQGVSMIFDVPVGAGCIRYGSILHGTGAVWLDSIVFDTVMLGTSTTLHRMKPEPLSTAGNCDGMVPKPTNLDFEQGP